MEKAQIKISVNNKGKYCEKIESTCQEGYCKACEQSEMDDEF